MKKLLVIIVLFSGFLFLSSCGNKDDVPVYEGMELSSIKDASTDNNIPMFDTLSYSSDSRSSVGNSSEENQDINAASNSGTLMDTDISPKDQVDYFSDANEDLFLIIHISNPASYEILSFTLNDTKYQSYEFGDGSNSNQLLLEVNSGDVEGIKTFTIDQIKYIDGTEINDVLIEGDQTIDLGVAYTDLPSVTVDDVEIGINDIKLNVHIDDLNNLLSKDNAFAKVTVYDETGALLFEEAIQDEDNSLIFQELSSHTDYTYEVIGYYDSLDGEGMREVLLSNDSFTTNGFMNIVSVDSQKDSLSFEVDVDDMDMVGEIAGIELYLDGELVDTLTDLNNREFTDLQSDQEYQIVVTYTYDLEDGNGIQLEKATKSASTKAKTLPVFHVGNIVPTQDSVTFEVFVDDPDDTGEITRIDLYKEDELVDSLTDLNNRKFTDLQSDQEYQIVVTYTYDLNDGRGETSIESGTLETFDASPKWVALKERFQYRVLDEVMLVVNNEEELTFEEAQAFAESNGGNLLTITSQEKQDVVTSMLEGSDKLYRLGLERQDDGNYTWVTGETLDYSNWGLNEPDNRQTAFIHDDQWHGTPYDEKLFTVIEISLQETFMTESKEMPTVIVDQINPGKESVTFEINIDDPDDTGEITAIELYQDDVLKDSLTDLSQREFTGLQSDQLYRIAVTYTYDLNDENGVQSLTTDIKNDIIEMIQNDLSEDVLVYDAFLTDIIVVSDPGLTLSFDEARTYAQAYGGDLATIKTKEKFDHILDMFENHEDHSNSLRLGAERNSDGEYVWIDGEPLGRALYADFNPWGYSGVVLAANYEVFWDLPKERAGNFIMDIPITDCFITQPKETPHIGISEMNADENSVTFNVNVEDPDGTGEITAIDLFKEGELVDSLTDLNEREFTDLQSSQEYKIVVTYTYDLNDGQGKASIKSGTLENFAASSYGGILEEGFEYSVLDDEVLILNDEEELTFEEAQAFAESNGGDLLTITSQEKQDVVIAMLEGTYGQYFLGIERQDDGSYKWLNGENIDYSNWAPTEPHGDQAAYFDSDIKEWFGSPEGDEIYTIVEVPFQGAFETK